MTSRPRPDGPVTADFFDEAYHRLMAPFHPESETRREVAALREILGLSQDDVVLDLGCGWGRHLRLLAEAGHRVVGLDLSPGLLGRLRDPSAPRVAGDMRWLPFRTATFDIVLNLATSLGLFLDDREAAGALSEARRVLRPAGRLLIEGMHRDDVVAGYAERDAWTMEDGTRVRARRRFDAIGGVSHEVLRWSGPRGDGTKRHSLRLRTGTELGRLVEDAGFTVLRALGGWQEERFAHDSERLILLARAQTLR
jgi:SAM-dependent methyltransferase